MKWVARVGDSLVLAKLGGEGGKLLQMETRELQKGEEGELMAFDKLVVAEGGLDNPLALARAKAEFAALRHFDFSLTPS